MVLLTAFPWRRPLQVLLLLLLPLRLPRCSQGCSGSAAAPKAAAGAAGAVSVKAPMPGNILDVKVSAGASVKAGDVLVILEAMKMENEILAPQDGTVASVNVNRATPSTPVTFWFHELGRGDTMAKSRSK